MDHTISNKFLTTLSQFHELLHLASTKFNKKEGKYNCGFYSKLKNGNNIGIAINEGYTEHLTKKYFGHIFPKHKSSLVYEVFENFFNIIEQIIVEDEMEYYYFNADLSGLIRAMGRYCSYKKANELINDMKTFQLVSDILYLFIERYTSLYNCTLFEYDTGNNIIYEQKVKFKIQILFRSIELTLLEMYINKQTKLVKNGIINADEMIENVYEFYNRNFVELMNVDYYKDKISYAV